MFPIEIFGIIFGCLPQEKLIKFRRVSRIFNNYITNKIEPTFILLSEDMFPLIRAFATIKSISIALKDSTVAFITSLNKTKIKSLTISSIPLKEYFGLHYFLDASRIDKVILCVENQSILLGKYIKKIVMRGSSPNIMPIMNYCERIDHFIMTNPSTPPFPVKNGFQKCKIGIMEIRYLANYKTSYSVIIASALEIENLFILSSGNNEIELGPFTENIKNITIIICSPDIVSIHLVDTLAEKLTVIHNSEKGEILLSENSIKNVNVFSYSYDISFETKLDNINIMGCRKGKAHLSFGFAGTEEWKEEVYEEQDQKKELEKFYKEMFPTFPLSKKYQGLFKI